MNPRGSVLPRWSFSKEMALKHLYEAAAVLALLLVVTASGAADIKIGYVDVERIRRESAPAERASKQLEKEFALGSKKHEFLEKIYSLLQKYGTQIKDMKRHLLHTKRA